MTDVHFEGKSVLEAHGYRCEYEPKSHTAYVYAPPNSMFPKGETFALRASDKTEGYLFQKIALYIAQMGEPFSGWSESLPAVFEVGSGTYKRWGDIHGKERSDDGKP